MTLWYGTTERLTFLRVANTYAMTSLPTKPIQAFRNQLWETGAASSNKSFVDA
jgi:hypothetical protein